MSPRAFGCGDARGLLAERPDRELAPRERADLESHLAADAAFLEAAPLDVKCGARRRCGFGAIDPEAEGLHVSAPG